MDAVLGFREKVGSEVQLAPGGVLSLRVVRGVAHTTAALFFFGSLGYIDAHTTYVDGSTAGTPI